MTQTNIFFTETEEKIISKFKNQFKLNKHETIKMIINKFNDIYKGAQKAD